MQERLSFKESKIVRLIMEIDEIFAVNPCIAQKLFACCCD